MDDSPTRLDLRRPTGDFASLRRADRPAGFAVEGPPRGYRPPCQPCAPVQVTLPAVGRAFLWGLAFLALGAGLIGGALATGVTLAWLLL